MVSRILAVAFTVLCCAFQRAEGMKRGDVKWTHAGVLSETVALSAKGIDPNVLSACIVETRKNAVLPMVILNLVKRFPGMKVQLFHSSTNANWVQDQPTLKRLQSEGILVLTQTPAPYYSGHVTKVGGFYSHMLASPNFWELTLTPKLLLFQADSWFCNGATAEKIEPMLKYDYVGAPWGHLVPQCPGGVGNGGLSIRDKAAMIRVSSQFKIGEMPEDVFFCSHLKASAAPRHVAKTFSREETSSEDQSVGVHAGTENWNEQLRAHLEARCPGASDMMRSHQQKRMDSADFKISEEMVQNWQSSIVPRMSFAGADGDDQAEDPEFAVSAAEFMRGRSTN